MSDMAPPPPPPPPPPAVPPPSGPVGPAGPQPFDVGAAFSWGWKKFQENLGPVLIAMLVYLVILVVVSFVTNLIFTGLFISSPTVTIDPNTGQLTSDAGSGMIAVLFVAALSGAISTILFAFLQAAIVRGGLMVSRGSKLEVGEMFKFDNFGMILVAAIIVSLLSFVGLFACYVGAIVVYFFTAFYMFFVVDKAPGAWASVVASFNLVKDNAGQVFLLLLLVFLANVAGAIVCGIGLLVSLPVTFFALTYGYRALQGESVAA